MNTLYYGDNLNILREYMGVRRDNFIKDAIKKDRKAGPKQEGLGI